MNSLYLIINIVSFLVPFIFSFHPKLAFYKEWKYIWPSIFLSAVPFILWDAYFTYLNVWGFNSSYLSGLQLINLPVEEVLFFICIPYSCLFTYHCLNLLIKKDLFNVTKNWITGALVVFLAFFSFIYSDRLYTLITFTALIMLLVFVAGIVKAKWLSRFYFSYLVLILPFIIVNGILTGTGIDHPVVWYNSSDIIGFRILTIPFEDTFYGMLLILLNTLIYETLAHKNAGQKNSSHISI